MSEQKFGGFSGQQYAELPVPAAFLSWVRGNAQLRSVAKDDPAAYLGGWRAFVIGQDNVELPSIPLPVVERVSQDGQHPYKVYSYNYINFLPIQHRTRFELRQKVKDEQTGREYERVVNVSKTRLDGYAPYRQVFGMLYSTDGKLSAPAVLKIWKWSAFISSEKADRAWDKIKNIPAGKALIRRYGTVGKTKEGVVIPHFEVYGQSQSTPIEAIGIDKPVFVDITDELNKLYDGSLEWKNCPKWNSEGSVALDETASVKSEFLKRCTEIGLTNVEIEQSLAENGNDYAAALASISEGVNDKLAEAEEQQF